MNQEKLKLFEERGCKVITTEIKNNKEPIEYICKCGETKKKTFSDFKRRGCRTCNSKQLTVKEEKEEYYDEENKEELWKPITGGWISSFGRAKNNNGILLKLCETKYRYHINGTNQYAHSLVAQMFKIPDYEKLSSKKYNIIHIDGNPLNNNINNLKVVTKSEVLLSKVRQECREKDIDIENIENKIIPELPSHTIYKNGEIWNGQRFLLFSKTDNYLQLCLANKSYKVHRLVCYAFNPLPDKSSLSDYKNLQVNHINGNTMDNRAENLEWCTNSENQKHAYETGLKKNVKTIIQFDKEGNEIARYKSVAEASRVSKEPEHRISAIIKGKTNGKATYNWKLEIREVEIKRINNFI